MFRHFLFSLLIAIISITGTGCKSALAQPSAEYVVEIHFVSYIQSGFLEQDVFVEAERSRSKRPAASGVTLKRCEPSNPCAKEFYVARARPQDALLPSFLAKPVYATTKVIPHDPYRVGVSAPGPFPAGDALGFTWGEWLAARGSGTYSVIEGHALLNLSFEGLIPGASYSLWCGRETPPPDYSSSDSPCGTGDGTQNQFRADAAGGASLSLEIKPVLPHTDQATTILSLSYDRVTANANDELGGYGFNYHVQLWYPFP